jgi:hypothetical protein
MSGYIMLDHVRPSNSRLFQVTSGELRMVWLGLDRLGEVRLSHVRSGYVTLGQVKSDYTI